MGDTAFMVRLSEALEHEDLAPATVERTLIDSRQFEEWLVAADGHGIDPDHFEITSVDLQEWRSFLSRKAMTPGTVARKFASIRKAIVLLAPELALRLRWPKLPVESRPSPSGFTHNQRRALMRAVERTDVRSQAILKLLLHTGARASTVSGAKLSRVSLRERGGEIEYDVSKGNRTYSVPLNSEVREALRRWIAMRPPVEHDYLFTSERFPYPPISRGVVWSIWKSLAAYLPKDFPLRGPHAARHDLARRLLSGDEGTRPPTPIQDVARILGHAGGDPRITAGVYGSPSEEDLRRALDGIIGEEEREE
jgi:integrase/recombinase XerC